MSRPREPGLNFRDQARRDDKVKKLWQRKKAGEFTLKTDALSQEILNLHANREFRNLSGRDAAKEMQNKIIAWSAELTAVRSRTVEIRMQAFYIKGRLDEHLKVLRRHLTETYARALKYDYKTKTDQMKAVEDVVAPFARIGQRLQNLIDLSDQLIEDLKFANFAVGYSIKALEILTRPERNM